MTLQQEHINKVHRRDVLEVLRELPDGSVDMVYGDPDYNVGINYAGTRYTQSWKKYIDWYIALAEESLRVLKPEGNLFFINYPKQNAYLRVGFLDEAAEMVQDYVWIYNTNVGHSNKRFTTAHRSVLHATKTPNNRFYKEQVVLPYQNLKDKRIMQRMQEGHKGRMPYSWFYFDLVKNVSKDKTFHACQIPVPLFELLLLASTKPKDSAFILFGGSGSEILSAKKHDRRYLSCEINSRYHKMILDRLKNGNRVMKKYRLFTDERADAGDDLEGDASPDASSQTALLENRVKYAASKKE